MKYVVIDLEMNPIAAVHTAEREVCRLEVIEIGAVLLDERYQEIGSFVTLVKPRFNSRIEKKYEKLTGIKTKMTESAPYFEDALDMFFSWCNNIPDEIQIIQWSENDFIQFSKEIQMKKILLSNQNQQYMNNPWLDFQAEYGHTLGIEHNISLKDAVMYAGEDFCGRQHDALVDARNTADLFGIFRDESKCQKALQHVIEVLKPKNPKTISQLGICSIFQHSRYLHS